MAAFFNSDEPPSELTEPPAIDGLIVVFLDGKFEEQTLLLILAPHIRPEPDGCLVSWLTERA